MGFRTVVLFNNDQSSWWQEDPALGKHINETAASRATWGKFRYGNILEVAHADCNTLAVIESFNLHPLAHSNWYQNMDPTTRDVSLLKDAADKLGYRLVRKSK
jgi:hypothetical protein